MSDAGTFVRRVKGYVARTATRIVEAFGFEAISVKPSGTTRASLRLIRPAQDGIGPAPSPTLGTPPAPGRYFTVNVDCEAGINHLKSALCLSIKEAVLLNRTPVAFVPRFWSSHNFGKEVAASWSRYIDLTKVGLIRNGTTEYIEVLERGAIGDDGARSVLQVKGKHLITPAENASYHLIVKENPSGLGFDNVYAHDAFDFEVVVSPPAEILKLAGEVAARLGTYHAMHVRRGDMLADRVGRPNLERDTQPENIRATLRRVLPKGSRIYIMTDEKDPGYFDLLKSDYELFQYRNFPSLAKIVEGGAPDNFYLYEVEKVVFEKAESRIYTFASPTNESRISLTTDTGWS